MSRGKNQTALDALCDKHRRNVVGRLRKSPVIRLSQDEELQVAMIHNHLPKMAKWGFVEYEKTDDGEIVVQRGERWGEVSTAHAALCEQGLPSP